MRLLRRTCWAAGLGLFVLAAVPVLVAPLNLLSAGALLLGYVNAALFTPVLFLILAFWVGTTLDPLELERNEAIREDSV